MYAFLEEIQTPATEISLHVSVAAQTLEIRLAGERIGPLYPVSTSRFGLGSEPDSLRTPLGRFRIHGKIGDGAPPGTVFRSRVPVAGDGLESTDEDLVLTRILWLDGIEEHNLNTLDRYIYLHGTNHESLIGQPSSHGCVRMRSADIVELYDRVRVGTEVHIVEE